MYNSIREESLEKLNDFISNGLKDYSKLRNYDFGQTKRTNVSNLSVSERPRLKGFVGTLLSIELGK